jgi:hypothetical protein
VTRFHSIPTQHFGQHSAWRAFGGYTIVPNQLLDEVLPALPVNERVVLLYLWRQIAGFHRQSRALSLTVIARGTSGAERTPNAGAGLSLSSTIRAIEGLLQRGYITRTRTARSTYCYTLCLDRLLARRDETPAAESAALDTTYAAPIRLEDRDDSDDTANNRDPNAGRVRFTWLDEPEENTSTTLENPTDQSDTSDYSS